MNERKNQKSSKAKSNYNKPNGKNGKNRYPGDSKGGYQSKGKRGDERSRTEETTAAERGFNHIEWYLKQPEMMKDVGTLSFANYTGVPVDIDPGTSIITRQSAFPSAMVYHYVPTFGDSSNAVSALNLAARDIYGFVRKSNAGGKNYDTPDLMLYIIALEQLHAAIAWAKRVYGLANTYYFTNRAVPTAYFDEMNVDFYSVTENMADFRYRLNTIINRANIMHLPNRYTILDRHRFLNESMFMDAPVIKAHVYMFQPDYFGRYIAMDGDVTYGQIVAIPNFSTGEGYRTYKAICDMLNDMLNAILSDQDMAIMNGDILKAYESTSKFVQIDLVGADYKCEPVMQTNVMPQIENITLVGNPVYPKNSLNMDVMVTQDVSTNNLLTTNVFKQVITSADYANPVDFRDYQDDAVLEDIYKCRVMIDMPIDNPTAADVVVATRLTNIPNEVEVNESGTEVHLTFDHVGSEVVTRAVLLSPLGDENPDVVNMWHKLNVPGFWNISYYDQGTDTAACYVSGALNVGYDADFVAAMTKFNHHPHVRNFSVTCKNGATLRVLLDSEAGSVSNFALLDAETLYKMHDLCIMGEFDVPARM